MSVGAAELVLPASPSNGVADDPAAATLGRRFFFDQGFSRDGSLACADCHSADEGWSDDRHVSLGVDDAEGGRHSMPVRTAALQRWWFWDGRADSMWSQAIAAMESEAEMDMSRAEAAHHVAANYAAEYEAVFGPLPDLTVVPARGKPGIAAWDALPDDVRAGVERVFSNIGKALEAYERRLNCADTRFDRWARGELEMTRREREGAHDFIRERCIGCHSGPNFSDGEFHNIGIGSNGPEPDRGRESGVEELASSVFNAAGPYSDDRVWGAGRLEAAQTEDARLGAFRTPSLRGVTQRTSFGHRGDRATLGEFLDLYDRVRSQSSAVGPLDPLVRRVHLNRSRDVIAFLKMLECPPVPAQWGPPQ